MNKDKLCTAKILTSRVLLLVTSYSLLVTTLGCEAFVRKFTRKPKEKVVAQEQIVLAPKEYVAEQMNPEEKYSYHFLYWKSWQDELIESLSEVTPNHKKQQECIKEALAHLKDINSLLKEEKQKELDAYIERLSDLKNQIEADMYGYNNRIYRLKAERIKRDIVRSFSLRKMKDYLS